MREWTLTLPRQLPLWEMESRWTPEISKSNFRDQNSMACDIFLYHWKALGMYMSKMGSHCSFGHLKHKLWPKEGPGVILPVWLPTRKSQELTRFTWLQKACNILLESSWRELQLCFKPHLDLRSARKVMGFQSHKSPNWRDFGTPTRESRERKAIWMWASWLAIEYTIRGKVWLPPSPSRGESSVSVLPVARPSTKGALTIH